MLTEPQRLRCARRRAALGGGSADLARDAACPLCDAAGGTGADHG